MNKNYQKHLGKKRIIKDDLPYKIFETYYKVNNKNVNIVLTSRSMK